jgi:hypothetical protein
LLPGTLPNERFILHVTAWMLNGSGLAVSRSSGRSGQEHGRSGQVRSRGGASHPTATQCAPSASGTIVRLQGVRTFKRVVTLQVVVGPSALMMRRVGE